MGGGQRLLAVSQQAQCRTLDTSQYQMYAACAWQ